MDIMMGLSAIKQTMDITKELRSIDGKLNEADFKLRLSDLVERLLEAHEALIDAKDQEIRLRAEIARLERSLAHRDGYRDEGGRLFELDENGRLSGEPFCNLCFVRHDKFFRMRKHEKSKVSPAHFLCDNCSLRIVTGPPIPPPVWQGPKRVV